MTPSRPMPGDRPAAIRRPAYLLESVDNALRTLQMIRDTGSMRLKDVADELDIAPSTAHRLLATLVYRGFVVQDGDKTYRAGLAMSATPAELDRTREMVASCVPHMQILADECRETVHLAVRVGAHTRFLHSAESSAQPVQVGDRRGQVLHAERTAAGRVLLADLPRSELHRLCRGTPTVAAGPDSAEGDFERLVDELARIRDSGIAISLERSEVGVGAVAAPVRTPDRRAIAAIAVTVPMARYRTPTVEHIITELKHTVAVLENRFSDHPNSAEKKPLSGSAPGN